MENTVRINRVGTEEVINVQLSKEKTPIAFNKKESEAIGMTELYSPYTGDALLEDGSDE